MYQLHVTLEAAQVIEERLANSPIEYLVTPVWLTDNEIPGAIIQFYDFSAYQYSIDSILN